MTPLRPNLAALLTALAVVPLLCAACRFDEPVEIPLLFEHEPEGERVEDTIPLLFSGWERQPAKDETRAWVLWPAFKYVREGRTKEFSVFGVPVARSRVDHRGFQDVDLVLGPVIYGHSADEGTYLTVFPLGGTMRGLFGKDYALGLLFPLFLYTEDKSFKSTHVLWPIFNVWHGGGRSGFRFFPLFAHYTRRDPDGRLAYRRTWILWPFFQTLENNLNSPAGAQRMWFLFPFYGRGDGPDTSQWTILFPFFKYFENRGSGFGGPGYDLRAPWPFVHIVRTRDRRTTDFWPFYGEKERAVDLFLGEGQDRYRRRFILWPFWRDEQQRTGEYVRSRWWLAPFLWSFEKEHLADRTSAREFKLWPLFRYKRWEDGRVAVNVISPLWFNDPEGAFERIYGPLTRVWHEWRDDEGGYRLELLWGLFARRNWRSDANQRASRTSLLFGLVQYERRATRKSLRFFWLPTGPDWGEGVAPPPRDWDEPGGFGGQRTPG